MAGVWLDVEDAAGVKQGRGAIEPLAWKWTARVDAAGAVEAKVPALDPQATLLASKVVVRAKGQYAPLQTLADFGAGVIDSIAKSGDGLAGTITAGGFDLLGELNTRIVGDLLLSDGAGAAMAAADVLDTVIAFAPSGWTTSGTPSRDVYQQFKGETVLAAYSKIAEVTGDHFRLGAGREVVWIAAGTFTASGVRAEAAGAPIALEGNTAVCQLMSITETADTHDVYSRIYPYGSGSGDARLTIAGIDTSGRPPTGYTDNIASAPYYIEKTATTTAYGLIEREVDFSDIGAAESSAGGTTVNAQSAANALYDAALRKLALAANPQKAYKLEIAGLQQALAPGTTIRVVYCGYVFDDKGNPLRWLDLNTDLFILAVTHDFDGHGLRKTTLDVTATETDQWPVTEASDVLQLKDAVRDLSKYRQPTTQAVVAGTYQPAWAVQSGAGALFGAYGQGDPVMLAHLADAANGEAVQPLHITNAVARVVRFQLPQDLALASVNLDPIGTTSGDFNFAIYAASGARVWQSGAQNTTNNVWLSISVTGVTLTAGTPYWFAVTCITGTGATNTFRCVPRPTNSVLYGADSGPLSALAIGIPELAQFAVTAGAFPSTLPALAAASGWTASVPFAFLIGSAS